LRCNKGRLFAGGKFFFECVPQMTLYVPEKDLARVVKVGGYVDGSRFTEYLERSLLVVIFSFAGITQFKFGDISQALITEVIVATPLEDRYDQD
jgi:hypothetical protein